MYPSDKEKSIMLKASKAAALSLTTAGLALIVACGSSSGSGSSNTGSSNTGSTAPVPAASGGAVSAQSTSLGTILVDSKGRTMYVFANDKANVSNCNGSCAAAWPPVTAPSPLPSSVSGVTGAIGSIARSDGSHQLTVAGHPVYTFSGDSAAGQTNGQGINLNGGVWNVVSPSGAPDTSTSGASQPAGSGY
jgi:predicted lipoprotein with Yx(FWY)xxD motif